MATTESWTDPRRCPFCGDTIASPGAGFMTHLETAPACQDAFDTWRDRVGGDVTRGWSG